MTATQQESKLAYIKKWRKDNHTQIATYRRNRCAKDLNFKLAELLRSRLRKALTKNCRAGSAVRDLGCSIEEFKTYIADQFQPGMSWENHGEWHLDHIIPLSAFNLTRREEFLIACHFTNYQPLWATDNLRKRAKIVSSPFYGAGTPTCWIQTQNTLPTVNKFVLCNYLPTRNGVEVGYLSQINGEWLDCSNCYMEVHVTHWAPLPLSPELASSDWVLTTLRLPTLDIPVMCYGDFNFKTLDDTCNNCIGIITEVGWVTPLGEPIEQTITHWQNLPLIPKFA